MPESVMRFTEEDKQRAAAAVHKMRHPNWSYTPGIDQWAYDYACAALEAIEKRELIRCDYCGDALPSVKSRAHIPTTPDLQRLGFDADKIVCPECVTKAKERRMKVDQGRYAELGDDVVTGIFVRAQNEEGKWVNVDMAVLDRPSLIEFIESRGEVSSWARGIILHLMSWPTNEGEG